MQEIFTQPQLTQGYLVLYAMLGLFCQTIAETIIRGVLVLHVRVIHVRGGDTLYSHGSLEK